MKLRSGKGRRETRPDIASKRASLQDEETPVSNFAFVCG